jgi:hypothetical protein
MNELSCSRVSDFFWADAGRDPIAAPMAPRPAELQKMAA